MGRFGCTTSGTSWPPRCSKPRPDRYGVASSRSQEGLDHTRPLRQRCARRRRPSISNTTSRHRNRCRCCGVRPRCWLASRMMAGRGGADRLSLPTEGPAGILERVPVTAATRWRPDQSQKCSGPKRRGHPRTALLPRTADKRDGFGVGKVRITLWLFRPSSVIGVVPRENGET